MYLIPRYTTKRHDNGIKKGNKKKSKIDLKYYLLVSRLEKRVGKS